MAISGQFTVATLLILMLATLAAALWRMFTD